MVRDHVREGAGTWVARSSSRLGVVGKLVLWFLILLAVVPLVIALSHRFYGGGVLAAVMTPSFTLFALILWWSKRGANVYLDFDSGELGNSGGRVPLSNFRYVKLRRYDAASGGDVTLERKRGWRVSLSEDETSHGVTVVDSDDELLAWRAAEAVARRLDIPLVDIGEDETVTRLPKYLDQPIVESLARMASVQPPLLPRPQGVEVIESDEQLRFVCQGLSPWAMFAVLAMGAFLGLLGVMFSQWSPLVGAIGLGLISLFFGWFGQRGLEATTEALTLFGPWFRRRRSIPVRALELIRFSGRLEGGRIHFVSDRKIVHLPMLAQHRDWVRRKLLHWLHSRYASAGPKTSPFR